MNPGNAQCPKVCQGVGSYKKVNLSDEEVQEAAKATKEVKNRFPAEAQQCDVENWSPTNNDKSEYLPALRPGKDGKVDWTPLSDLTGTRPRVGKYTVSRYSLLEWNKHNEQVLNNEVNHLANTIDYDSKTAMMTAFGNVDKQQRNNNDKLKQKAKELFRWKAEVEQACKAMAEEVELLEIERQRLKGASRVLMLPESIAQECLDLRSNRAVPDLVADIAEQELLKEFKIINEIRTGLKNTLAQLEKQQIKNKTVKHKIEYDWCDKKLAYDVDCLNMSLSPMSQTILFRPGATKFGEYSATLEYWEWFCRESIQNCEAARQESADLRGSFHALLVNGGRKLRMQADKTDTALAETVAIQNALCAKLEDNLHQTLTNIAGMETLIDDLRNSIRKMDAAMKLAQTRIDNRNIVRGRGESVRDQPHLGLLEEVKKIHEAVTGIRAQMHRAESVRNDLLCKRIELEKDIASKRKTLNIDRSRCGMIRSYFPSASELAGY